MKIDIDVIVKLTTKEIEKLISEHLKSKGFIPSSDLFFDIEVYKLKDRSDCTLEFTLEGVSCKCSTLIPE